MSDEDASVAGMLDLLSEHSHNDLKVFQDEEADLRGFIAVHDTTLGPAVGGTRRYPFDSEEEAIRDALRLSRAMTYKYAISDIDLGGAKGVIWTKSDDQRSEELYRSYGRVVDDLGGRFITGADVGTDEQALRWVNKETDYVLGLPEQTETPARYHAGGLGVYKALEAACDLTYSTRELSDLHVVVQGAGAMGQGLIHYLSEADAQVTIADVNEERLDRIVEEYGVGVVQPDEIYSIDCDVFAPCALGGVLNDETIPKLTSDIVCGAANNQLETPSEHGQTLRAEEILYVPDFLANSGQTINNTDVLRKGGYRHERVRSMIGKIYDRMVTIGKQAESENRPTHEIAQEIARDRIAAIRSIRSPVSNIRTPQW